MNSLEYHLVVLCYPLLIKVVGSFLCARKLTQPVFQVIFLYGSLLTYSFILYPITKSPTSYFPTLIFLGIIVIFVLVNIVMKTLKNMKLLQSSNAI